MVYKISVDAGHGINTAGKRTPDNEREWSFNDKVVDAFIAEIKKYEDVAVLRVDDPTGKTDVPLSTRTKDINAWDADIHISFHHNALLAGGWGNHTGVETFVYSSRPATSVKLAEAVHPALVKAYGLKDRGIKSANLHMVRVTDCPAILVEGGFMDSRIDIKKLRNNTVLKNAGIGIAKAVAKFAGLSLRKSQSKPVSKPSNNKITGKTYKVKKGDTLWGISKDSGVSVANIKKYNGLKSNLINIGQVLKLVPVPTSTGIKQVGTIKMTGVNNFTYIYAKTNDKSKKLGKAYKNKTFPIAGSVTGWWEIIHNGKRAYIKSKYASKV